MDLATRVEQDYITAYKAKNQVLLGVLRLLKTSAKNKQVELMRPLTDEDWMDVIQKQAKQRLDSIEQYTQAGRSDLAIKEEAELHVLKGYLPEELNPEALAAAIEEACAPHLAEGMKAMGKAIQTIMGKYKGRVDGKAVSDGVKARLMKS